MVPTSEVQRRTYIAILRGIDNHGRQHVGAELVDDAVSLAKVKEVGKIVRAVDPERVSTSHPVRISPGNLQSTSHVHDVRQRTALVALEDIERRVNDM
ncbi:hypothetical protein D3C79_944280 [compost metagenome]